MNTVTIDTLVAFAEKGYPIPLHATRCLILDALSLRGRKGMMFDKGHVLRECPCKFCQENYHSVTRARSRPTPCPR